jgi:hypothetical protein
VRTGRDAAEEGGTRSVQAVQHDLHDLGVEVVVLGADLLDGWQLRQ